MELQVKRLSYLLKDMIMMYVNIHWIGTLWDIKLTHANLLSYSYLKTTIGLAVNSTINQIVYVAGFTKTRDIHMQ